MLVHTGVIYVGRDPRPVAEAIHSINDAQLLGERRVHLKLIGQCLDSELHRDLRSRGHRAVRRDAGACSSSRFCQDVAFGGLVAIA